jgi:hypothetical protein
MNDTFLKTCLNHAIGMWDRLLNHVITALFYKGTEVTTSENDTAFFSSCLRVKLSRVKRDLEICIIFYLVNFPLYVDNKGGNALSFLIFPSCSALFEALCNLRDFFSS